MSSYSPDFNPIEYLWRNVKKDATHLKYFADFVELQEKADKTLQQLATLSEAILGLMGRYCESLLRLRADQCICGLVYILVIALRALTLLELAARRQLAQQPTPLADPYAGNPRRTTQCPTAERLL